MSNCFEVKKNYMLSKFRFIGRNSHGIVNTLIRFEVYPHHRIKNTKTSKIFSSFRILLELALNVEFQLE